MGRLRGLKKEIDPAVDLDAAKAKLDAEIEEMMARVDTLKDPWRRAYRGPIQNIAVSSGTPAIAPMTLTSISYAFNTNATTPRITEADVSPEAKAEAISSLLKVLEETSDEPHTGAERYFAKQLEDPEYRAYYENAKESIATRSNGLVSDMSPYKALFSPRNAQ